MPRRFPDDRLRPTNDAKPDELQKELLKQVLSATQQGRRTSNRIDDRYRDVLNRWRGKTEWNAETIGTDLVASALRSWFDSVETPQASQRQLAREIATALFDDPIASIQFKKWWTSLQESHG